MRNGVWISIFIRLSQQSKEKAVLETYIRQTQHKFKRGGRGKEKFGRKKRERLHYVSHTVLCNNTVCTLE